MNRLPIALIVQLDMLARLGDTSRSTFQGHIVLKLQYYIEDVMNELIVRCLASFILDFIFFIRISMLNVMNKNALLCFI